MPSAVLRSQLASALAVEPAAAALARRVCQVLRGLLDADGAAITLETSAPHRVTLHATGSRAEALENLQDVLGEGPGMDAFGSGQVVRATLATAAGPRWPFFVPAARDLIGPEAQLWAIPMRAAGEVIGSVTLYRLRPGEGDMPLLDAQEVADAAAAVLTCDPSACAMVTGAAADDPWSARAVVHQAAGMLAAHCGEGTDAALGWLRGYAFASGRHLTDVAREVVCQRLPVAGQGQQGMGC